MIALCVEHHRHADGGAFTVEQLRGFKRAASDAAGIVSARFDWLRNDLLAIAGGVFFHEVRTIFQYRDMPVIWFNRDEAGHLLLNIRMLSRSHERRLWIEDHGWVLHGAAEDVECPPTGRLLNVKYPDGDGVRVEFYEVGSIDELEVRFPNAELRRDGVRLAMPITACELHYAVGGTNIRFGPRDTTIPGAIITGGFFSRSPIGIRVR